jgi:hypothetical protein
MSRPLVISDCDEVLLHMVAPFKAWVEANHGVHFSLQTNNFAAAMRHADDGRAVEPARIWQLLDGFFDTQMHAQPAIAGAVEAVGAIADRADFVILTNLGHSYREARTRQLADLGIHARVFTNQGPRARRSRPSSKNTSPRARCSSTTCPSITIPPPASPPR